jgi:hypothetical protein|tara:strand:- start:137 stop:466 length:330 start_codon:yes stop_codon:yes gene_type:complete
MSTIIKIFFLLNILMFFSSCGTVRDAFTNQKKNSSDEFLVEKKSPLVMPPDYDDLPVPKSSENDDQKINNSNKIQDLITNNENKNTDNLNDNTQGDTIEKSLLEKIKQN